ncbi:hypothetical protein PV325_008020 [Microctonus aethiopoides]|uniref:Uncharacterized protein n=1 Tax=Microctonus aethiopoides TaxID=144406 RepID=A0AA39FIS8_9HYME|nr:hypothetical protein PV325_008020 [Microctonus aethiopoides]KAK0170357.1 hypothetical protein PV328_010928 [Microctonus aethiopoides]
MRSINISLFLFIILTSTRGQLNYEGNPLTENTEYTAEESHYSKRNDPRLSAKYNEHNVKVIDSYVAAANSLIHDDEARKSTVNPSLTVDKMPENVQMKQTTSNNEINPSANLGSLNYQVPSITSLDLTSREQIQPANEQISNQRYDNTNVIQMITPRKISSLPSSNEALNYFLKSQTPEESQLALENYLHIQNQNERIHGQLMGAQVDNKQNYISSSQDTNQQLLSDNISNGQSVSGTTLIPNSYPIDQQIYQIHPSTLLSSSPSSSSGSWHQIPIQNRRDFIAHNSRQRRPMYNYYGSAVRPFRGRQRVQTRIGHGPHYPPTSFIGGGGKPPGEIIYTRPPGFHGPPGPVISNSLVPYEDASAHYPDSNHPPVSKDIFYSQLYSQSYDPYYYDYIGKTGKIKPWLYGKLGPKEESGFWHELYHSFKNHGMKNMMNPMFLLGLSIPAVTLMLSAMVSKRSFDARSIRGFNQSDWSWNVKELEKMQANLLAAIQCVNEKKANGEDINKCAER